MFRHFAAKTEAGMSYRRFLDFAQIYGFLGAHSRFVLGKIYLDSIEIHEREFGLKSFRQALVRLGLLRFPSDETTATLENRFKAMLCLMADAVRQTQQQSIFQKRKNGFLSIQDKQVGGNGNGLSCNIMASRAVISFSKHCIACASETDLDKL